MVGQIQSHDLDFSESDSVSILEFSVLSAIASNPGIDQTTVVANTFIGKSNLVSVLTRMESHGLIWVVQNQRDARRSALYPTFEGRRFVYKATREVIRRNQLFLAPLGDKRVPFLRALEITAFYGQEERRSHYVITCPDEVGEPIIVTWGIGRLLRANTQRYARLWSASVKNVSPQQYAALRAIDLSPQISPGELSQVIATNNASVSEMTNGLIKRGLVDRQQHPDDKRRASLQLTTSGEKLLPAITKQADQLNHDFFAGLKQGDLGLILECLQILAHPA